MVVFTRKKVETFRQYKQGIFYIYKITPERLSQNIFYFQQI